MTKLEPYSQFFFFFLLTTNILLKKKIKKKKERKISVCKPRDRGVNGRIRIQLNQKQKMQNALYHVKLKHGVRQSYPLKVSNVSAT